jgi:hypothetical protein
MRLSTYVSSASVFAKNIFMHTANGREGNEGCKFLETTYVR